MCNLHEQGQAFENTHSPLQHPLDDVISVGVDTEPSGRCNQRLGHALGGRVVKGAHLDNLLNRASSVQVQGRGDQLGRDGADNGKPLGVTRLLENLRRAKRSEIVRILNEGWEQEWMG